MKEKILEFFRKILKPFSTSVWGSPPKIQPAHPYWNREEEKDETVHTHE